MNSFALGIGKNAFASANMPKTYYIVGSNDGTLWYPIQYGNFTINLFNSISSYITINTSNTKQTLYGGTVGTVTTTSYDRSNYPYMYFRIIGTSLLYTSLNSTYMEIGEWFTNFTVYTPKPINALSMSNSGKIMMVSASSTISPNLLGISSNTWVANGVTWNSSVSSVINTNFPAWTLFNNIAPSSAVQPYSWASGSTYNGSGVYIGLISTSILEGIGSITGEWIQLQSSIPLTIHSYSYGCGANTGIAKLYYIVGSNDGTNWYPIQLANITTNPFNSNFKVCTSYILVNQSGKQTITGDITGSGTFTTYSTTSNAYTYFRLIANSTFGAPNVEYTELYINFQSSYIYNSMDYGSTWSNPLNTFSTSATSATSSKISPNLAGISSNTWVANNITWNSKSSTNYTTSFPYKLFNKVISSASNEDVWASHFGYAGSLSENYTGSVTTTVLGGIGTVLGEWFQIQSSVPLVMSSYSYSCYNPGSSGKTYYIVGSTDETNWYPIQYAAFGSTNPFTAQHQDATTYIIVNYVGQQTFKAGATGTLTTTTYPTTTNAYTYFRVIGTSLWSSSSNHGLFQYSEFTIIYDYTIYGSTLSNSITLPSPNIIAVSGNSKYTIVCRGKSAYVSSTSSLSTYLTPTLSGINESISALALSFTGQYVLIVTNSSTNNVFYSLDYGVTFSVLTLGSLPLTACAVSADGSYAIVSNATTIYTLNRNTRGYSVTIGNTAGQTNQGLNAIAIGNAAGKTNQSANSIVLNASGTDLEAYQSGFYAGPINTTSSSSQSSVSLLGYGGDSQITQTDVSVNASGALTTSSLIAYTDEIAQAIYLTPSTENSSMILKYFQKVANTVCPTGTSSFWINGMQYGTSSPTISGGYAYTGGVLLPDGRVVFVPSYASTVGVFNPLTDSYITIAGAPGNNAYSGGVLLPDGRVVLVPTYATNIGIFNPTTNAFTTISISGPANTDKYVGGVLLHDGRVLFVPLSANNIGIFNPTTNTFSTIEEGAFGVAAFFGGVLLPDGRVVFVPYNMTNIGIFNPTTNKFSTISVGAPGGGAYRGGVLLTDGRVLFVPFSANNIGIFNPVTNNFSTISVAAGVAGYSGGVLLPDGRVVFVPLSSTTIGIFNPKTSTFTTIAGAPGNNAYAGGVLLPDGRVVLVPQNTNKIGILNTGMSAPVEMCLSPYCNKF